MPTSAPPIPQNHIYIMNSWSHHPLSTMCSIASHCVRTWLASCVRRRDHERLRRWDRARPKQDRAPLYAHLVRHSTRTVHIPIVSCSSSSSLYCIVHTDTLLFLEVIRVNIIYRFYKIFRLYPCHILVSTSISIDIALLLHSYDALKSLDSLPFNY